MRLKSVLVFIALGLLVSLAVVSAQQDVYFVHTAKGDFDRTLNSIAGSSHDLSGFNFKTNKFKIYVDERLLSRIHYGGVESYEESDMSYNQNVDGSAEIVSITRHLADRESGGSSCTIVPASVFAGNRIDISDVEIGGSVLDLSSTSGNAYIFKDEQRDRWAVPSQGSCYPTIHSSRVSGFGQLTTTPTFSGGVWAGDGYVNTYGNGAYVYVDSSGQLHFRYETQRDESRVVFSVGILGCECDSGEESCSGSEYLTCDNDCSWTNNGEVIGECGITTTHSCSENDRIMKLYSSENSHGALWDDTNYDYDICYSSIFGHDYTGGNPHSCTLTNKVLELYQTSNSHAQANGGPNAYDFDVCYGDLGCEADSSPGNSCTNGGEIVVRLYQDTNSHISNSSNINYPIKICCREGAITGQSYWANMQDSKITNADITDRVKMIWPSSGFLDGSQFRFEIYERDENILDADDEIRTESLGNAIYAAYHSGDTKLEAAWEILTEDIEKGENEDASQFFFRIYDSSNNLVNTSGLLEVSINDYENSPPVAEITGPESGGIYFVGENIHFSQGSYDLDDFIEYEWDLGDGTVRTGNTIIGDPNYFANYEFDYQYTSPGQMDVILTVIDERGLRSEHRIPILIIDNSMGSETQYILAKIDSPAWSSYIRGYNASFDASSSFAVETASCDGTTCAINCLLGGCPATTSDGSTTIGDPYSSRGDYSDLNFSWTFDDSSSYRAKGDNGRIFKKAFGRLGKHSAKLNVSLDIYNKMSSTETKFTSYLDQACRFDFDSGNWLWWDEFAMPHDPREDFGYCVGLDGVIENSKDNCCPLGYSCQTSNGPETALCEVSIDDECSSIVSCEDYSNEDDCLEDVCGRGELQPGTGCGGTIQVDEVCGAEYYTSREDECLCVWDDSAPEGEKCSHSSNLWSTVFTTLPVIHSCKSQTTHGNCVDGLMNMKVDSTITWNNSFITGFLTSPPSDFLGSTTDEAKIYLNDKCNLDQICGNYEGMVVCGKATTKLTFFTIASLIVVIIVLVIIYVILIKKKAHKEKGRKKKR